MRVMFGQALGGGWRILTDLSCSMQVLQFQNLCSDQKQLYTNQSISFSQTLRIYLKGQTNSIQFIMNYAIELFHLYYYLFFFVQEQEAENFTFQTTATTAEADLVISIKQEGHHGPVSLI